MRDWKDLEPDAKEGGKEHRAGGKKTIAKYIALKNLFLIKEQVGKDLKKHNYCVKKKVQRWRKKTTDTKSREGEFPWRGEVTPYFHGKKDLFKFLNGFNLCYKICLSRRKQNPISISTCFYNFISTIINKKYCSFLILSIQFVENS